MSGGAGRLLAVVALVLLAGCANGVPTSPPDDPLSAVDDPGRRADLLQQLDALPRYEAASRELAADPVPLDHDVAVMVGRQALRTSQLTAQVLDRARFPHPLGFDTDAYRAELEAGARGSSLQLAAVARNLDAAQTLLLDPDTRRSLLVTPHVDQAGAVALLERATERVVPVVDSAQGAAADATQNAQVAAAVLTDLAQDPYGWRAAIGRGTPISDAITGIVAEHIDAFADAGPPGASVRIDEGFSGGFGLSSQDAQDVLTFVGAGRAGDGPDTDLVRVHVAAQQFTRYEVARAASGALDPGTAFGTAAGVTLAVDTADFRTAMHVRDDADAAREDLFANGSLATGLVADEALHHAAAPPPGLAGDGIPALVHRSVAGYRPEGTGRRGTAPADVIAGRYLLDTDHLVVTTLSQAGRLPTDVPGLDAVTDESGRMSPLASFSDGSPDPDVTATDVPPDEALAAITRTGPAGAGPEWGAAVRDHDQAIRTGLRSLDPDQVRRDPRTPLESDEVDGLRGRDRIPWALL